MTEMIHLPIDGIDGFAWVSEIGQRNQHIYRVMFSNEYHNVFYKDVETGEWIEEDLGYTELAQHVGSRINSLRDNPIHVPKLLIWHCRIYNGREVCFGFTSVLEDDKKLYEIYDSHKKFLYTLVEDDENGWEILGNLNLINGNIDHEFLEEVVATLSIYSE